MAKLQSTLIKSLIAACTIGFATLAAPAQAYVWQTPYGQWMSNTCVAPNGAFMNFANQAGPVGAPCQFYFYGMPGMYYGVYR